MSSMLTFFAATDFSEDSRAAVHRAALLARERGAQLSLVHVMSGPSLHSLRGLLGMADDIETRLVDEAWSMLAALGEEARRGGGLEVHCEVKTGSVVDEILALAEPADVLFLGAHGSSALSDLLLGTTADRVLRRSRQPVLVAKRFPRGPYSKVLVPVAFGPSSVEALRWAALVAPEGAVVVFHVFSVPYEARLHLTGVPVDDIEKYVGRARQEAWTKMNHLVHQAGHDARMFHRSVDHGEAVPRILEEAALFGADLIIIGKHGQSAVEEILLGSVTRHVLAGSTSDVLVMGE